MFGTRMDYKEHFQLWIPELLMGNWSKCFAFHKLALDALQSGAGAPVWLADHKTTPTAPSSIDRSSVDFEGGEMSFGLFEFDRKEMQSLFCRGTRSDQDMLKKLRARFSDREFPPYVFRYLEREVSIQGNRISFHGPSTFGTAASKLYTRGKFRTFVELRESSRRTNIDVASYHMLATI